MNSSFRLCNTDAQSLSCVVSALGLLLFRRLLSERTARHTDLRESRSCFINEEGNIICNPLFSRLFRVGNPKVVALLFVYEWHYLFKSFRCYPRNKRMRSTLSCGHCRRCSTPPEVRTWLLMRKVKARVFAYNLPDSESINHWLE